MKKPWMVVLMLLLVLPALLDAQGRGGRGRGGGSRGGSGRGAPPKDDGTGTESKPAEKEKPADLAVLSITAKWKDAKTLEIIATVKNVGPGVFLGSRTALLRMTGKDSKLENVKSESLSGLAVGETQVIRFETTDKKHFDKDLKWTLELAPSDEKGANDKKTATVNPGPQPKS